MHGIWKSWMTIWCLAAIAFGVILAGMAFPATDAAARTAYDILGSDVGNSPDFDAPGMRFSIGLVGAVTIGWGLTILAIVRTEAGGPALWRWLAGMMIAWFAIDSSISIATGFPLNAVSNTVFLAGFLLPVLASGRFGVSRSAVPA